MYKTDIDFESEEIIVSDEWRQLTSPGRTEIKLSDGMTVLASHEVGMLFDHASIPKVLPFFRRWRFSKYLRMASYIHDIYFIHQYKDYKRAAWVMDEIMKMDNAPSFMRSVVHKAVSMRIAGKLFSGRNKYDLHNMSLSSIEEVPSV